MRRLRLRLGVNYASWRLIVSGPSDWDLSPVTTSPAIALIGRREIIFIIGREKECGDSIAPPRAISE